MIDNNYINTIINNFIIDFEIIVKNVQKEEKYYDNFKFNAP